MKLLNRIKKQVATGTVIALALSMPVSAMANDYSSHWAKDVITEWTQYGVVGGYEDGSFKPNNQMTRAEFAVVLSNVFGLTSVDTPVNFSDVKTGAWYHDAIDKVAAAGMMQGADGKFNPSSNITRQEAAVALVNAYNLTEKGNVSVSFTDNSQIAAWAKEQVALMASNGYIGGRENGSFDPKANITRAEVLTMLDNMTAALVHKAGDYAVDAKGNVIVNTPNVVLKNMNISGNLYLAQGIGLGDATLENVTVDGNIFVAGGGINSIHFNKVTAKKAVQVKAHKPVRLVSKDSKLSVVTEAKEVVLTGTFGEVVIPAGTSLKLQGATVDKITVLPGATDASATIVADKTSIVKELVVNAATTIQGEGKFEKLPESTLLTNKVETSKPSTGGGGGGGGSITPSKAYIKVAAITVNGGSEDLKGHGLEMTDNNITLNLQAMLAAADKVGNEITSMQVQLSNVASGETITGTLTLGAYTVERTLTVGKDGIVNISVAEVVEIANRYKEELIEKVKDKPTFKHIEAVLEAAGLSIDDNYLSDGSINVTNLVETYGTLLAMYENPEAHGISESVKVLKGILEDYGVVFGADSVTFGKNTGDLTGKLTINAGKLGAADYIVKIVH